MGEAFAGLGQIAELIDAGDIGAAVGQLRMKQALATTMPTWSPHATATPSASVTGNTTETRWDVSTPAAPVRLATVTRETTGLA